MKTRPAILAAAIGAALVSTPSFADSVNIRFADLDLATQQGQAQLARRIDAAARAICGLKGGRTGTRLPSEDGRRCYENAKASAQQQVAARIASEAPKSS